MPRDWYQSCALLLPAGQPLSLLPQCAACLPPGSMGHVVLSRSPGSRCEPTGFLGWGIQGSPQIHTPGCHVTPPVPPDGLIPVVPAAQGASWLGMALDWRSLHRASRFSASRGHFTLKEQKLSWPGP